MGWMGVITNAGAALLAQWAGGSQTLYITKATVGSGYVAEVNMRGATALQTEKANASIIENKAVGFYGRRFRIRVGPAASTAYTAHEIGIWAKLGSTGTETLLSLHQDAVDGQSVPTEAASPEFVFDLNTVLGISNDGEIDVNIDTAVYVSNGQFMDEVAIQRLMAEGIPNCEATPSFDAYDNITGITHVDVDTLETMRSDVFTRHPAPTNDIVEVRTLSTGEVLTITTNLTTKKTTYIFS